MNDDIDEATKAHLMQVNEWLEKHVEVIPQPEEITLSQFSVNWLEFDGDFRVAFDSYVYHEKLRFGLDASGLTKFYYPIFCSPLGAPASYPAIDITAKTEQAILKALRKTIPKVMGAGVDKETGREIFYSTPPLERIEAEQLLEAKKKVNASYTITVRV